MIRTEKLGLFLKIRMAVILKKEFFVIYKNKISNSADFYIKT